MPAIYCASKAIDISGRDVHKSQVSHTSIKSDEIWVSGSLQNFKDKV